MALTRRQMMQLGLGAAAGAWLAPRGLLAAEKEPAAPAAPATTGPVPPADFGLPTLGAIKPRKAKDIKASALSVGFETLDRRHFDPVKTYPHMAELGVKWARCQTGWGRTETVKGQYDFTWLDEVVDSLLKIGVQPWFNLGYGNPLYVPEAKDEAAVGYVPIYTDTAKEGWLKYVRTIAARYADRVKVWEIWNEPNIAGFWKPTKPNGAEYAGLVKMTAPEIRKLIPGAVIVGCGLAGMPMGYLKECLEAGLAEHVDKISYHPYRPVPESGYEKEVKEMRDLIAKFNPKIAIWQGENGAPSVKGGAGALSKEEWNEPRQARWLLRRIVGDLRLEVELTSYFLIVDLVGYRGSTNYKGILRGKDYSPKPAYFAYQHVAALFDAESKRSPLAVTASDAEKADKVITAAFVRGGRPLYVYWLPENLMKDVPAGKVTLKVTTAAEAKLEKPVLADLLTGRTYTVAAGKKDGDTLVFENLPLTDYPLVLTDAAVVA